MEFLCGEKQKIDILLSVTTVKYFLQFGVDSKYVLKAQLSSPSAGFFCKNSSYTDAYE